MKKATFYFDLLSPYAYLTATRIDAMLGADVIWQPILLGALMKQNGDVSWAITKERDQNLAEIEKRRLHYGLPPITYPADWPQSSLTAMRGAIAAQHQGKIKEYTLMAYQMVFVEGKNISQTEVVLEAAQRSDLEIELFAREIQSVEVKEALRIATEQAAHAGVSGVPTIIVDGNVYFGDDRLEEIPRTH